MRLEVLADTKGAVIYVLNRPEIYIGSTENNDIVIPSAEISKKHLKVIVTDDQKCFVIDQGSTNGSYINDQRLVPGKREELKLFTSMRLGEKVLLTLLDKDKGEMPELPVRDQFVEENKVVIADEDKTRVISLKTLQKTKTEKVKKKRLKKLEKDLKRKKQLRNDKKILNKAIMSALVVIGLAFGAMKLWDIQKKRKARGTIAGTMKETQIMIDDSLESMDENIVDLQIPQALLLSAADIAKHAEDVNCSLPEELFFCKRMPRGSRKKNGAINLNNQIVIYLEQKEWLSKAQELVALHNEVKGDSDSAVNETEKVAEKRIDAAESDTLTEPAPEAKQKDELSIEVLNRIAFLLFFKTHFPSRIPQEYQAMNLYFVFYTHTGAAVDVESILAIRGNHISEVNSRFTEDFFRFKKYNPYQIIKRLDRFYRVY